MQRGSGGVVWFASWAWLAFIADHRRTVNGVQRRSRARPGASLAALGGESTAQTAVRAMGSNRGWCVCGFFTDTDGVHGLPEVFATGVMSVWGMARDASMSGDLRRAGIDGPGGWRCWVADLADIDGGIDVHLLRWLGERGEMGTAIRGSPARPNGCGEHRRRTEGLG